MFVCCECGGQGFEPRIRDHDGDVDLVDCRHCGGLGICADPVPVEPILNDLGW